MKKNTKNTASVRSDIVVTATASDFRNGTRNRTERLVKALKPITDKWYCRFVKASQDGSDAVLFAYKAYRTEYISTEGHPDDEIFRYAALAAVLHSAWSDSFLDINVLETTSDLLKILLNEVCSQVEWWFPRQRFEDEMWVFDNAKNINFLSILGNWKVGK